MRFRPLFALIVPLVLAGALAGPLPAVAAGVFALDPVIELPEEPEGGGNTSPAVALRPDGGMVTVWVDLASQAVVGRWFGPTDGLSVPASGRFVLSEGGDAGGGVVLARGAGDAYLAVWQGPGVMRALSARALDGEGSAIGTVHPVAAGSVTDPAVAARPGGGYVISWWEAADGQTSLWLRITDALGASSGRIQVAELPDDGQALGTHVAVGPDGDIVVSWNARLTDSGTTGVWARAFSAVGLGADSVIEVVTLTGTASVVSHDLAEIGGGDGHAELLAIWDERSGDGSSAIRARHFHPDGTLAAARRVDVESGEPGFASLPAIAGAADGQAVAAWYEELPERRIAARLLAGDATPRSDPFTVASWDDFTEFANRIDLDRDHAGRLAFAWGIGVDFGILPPANFYQWSGRARRLHETLDDCAPLLTLDFRTEPVSPTEDDGTRLVFEGLADCAALSPGTVSLEPDGFHVRPDVEYLVCGTFPPFPYEVAVDVGELPAGDYPVSFEIVQSEDSVCARSFEFTVAPGEVEPPPEPPPPPPPHPDAPPLTSDELPGFRAWVRISAAGESVLGAKEDACIPETLCVSGRVPGRSEVFVRVVGPKPNGRLWPTLVKFTTSTAEVWIEQISTGEALYYRLEGASPGVDELPGLFDREGFEP